MKRTIAILFLNLLLYNSVGHGMVLNYLKKQCERLPDLSLTEPAREETLKVHKLFSPSSSLNSVELNSDFVIEDKVYQLVKWEAANDTLYLYCKDKSGINKSIQTCGEHAQMASENHEKSTPAKQVNLPSGIKDYAHQKIDYYVQLHAGLIVKVNTAYSFALCSFKPKVSNPPPEIG